MDWTQLLFVALAMTAVIAAGHFAWVLVAWFLGFKVSTRRRGTDPAVSRCPNCGHAGFIAGDACATCGFTTAPSTLDGLNQATVQVTRLFESGAIDAQTHGRVMAALRAEQKRVATASLLGAGPSHYAHGPPPLPVLSLEESREAYLDDPSSATPVEQPANVEAAEHEPYETVPEAAADTWIHTSPAPPSVSAPFAPPYAVPPAPPRRPLAQMLAAFMEQNNIRWGELVGGLLIVGCSVALVLSFWSRIAQVPFLRFAIFTAVTGALFGLGLYTEHRWKLPTTSRGILLIATLLVPLNFLAFAAFSAGPLTLGAEAVAFALFAYLLWHAGKVVAPFWPGLLAGGASALAATTLAVGAWHIDAATPLGLNLLALLPLGCYAIVIGWMLARARRWRTFRAPAANAIFLLLGVTSFAAVLALGLLIYRAPDSALALRRLASLLSLGGIPALTCGLLLWRRIVNRRLWKLRIAGTAVAIAGAAILLAGIVFAWPDPAGTLPVALCDFAALTAIAFVFDIPAAHFLALPCLALAWLLGFHRVAGHVSWVSTATDTFNAMFSCASGAALVPLVFLLAVAREALERLRRPRDGVAYGAAGIAFAVVSITLVSWIGFAGPGDPYGATWVYAFYAAAGLFLAWRTGRMAFAFASSLVLCIGVTVRYVLWATAGGQALGGREFIRLLQLSAMIMSGFAAVWLAARQWHGRSGRVPDEIPRPLLAQLSIALALNAAILIPATAILAFLPGYDATLLAAAGGIWGWAALLLSISAALLSARAQRDRLTIRLLAFAAMASATMLGLSLESARPHDGWLAFHGMLGANAAGAWGVLVFAWYFVKRHGGAALQASEESVTTPPPSNGKILLNYQRASSTALRLPVFFGGQPITPAAIRWSFNIGLLVVAMGVRAMADDPGAPWWSMGAALAIALLSVACACWGMRPAFLYAAGLLLNLAASMWFISRGDQFPGNGTINFLCVNTIALALPGIAWLVLELQVFRRGPAPLSQSTDTYPLLAAARRAASMPPGRVPAHSEHTRHTRWPAFHHVAALGAVLLAGIISVSGAFSRFAMDATAPGAALAWLAVLSAGALLFMCLRDPRARYSVGGLYAIGLALVGLGFAAIRVSWDWLPWVLITCFAGYALLTSLLFNQGDTIHAWAGRRGLVKGKPVAGGIPIINTALAAITIVAGCFASFAFASLPGRVMIAAAALAQALSLGLLSRRIQRRGARGDSLLAFAIGAVIFAWAWTFGAPHEPLHRAAIAFCAMTVLAGLYALIFPRWLAALSAEWAAAARSSARLVAAGAAIALLATIYCEGALRFAGYAAPLHAIGGWVLATLLAACAVMLRMALHPGRDRPRSERQRMGCVYAAEALLAMAFIHLRLAEPQWFAGFLRPYWPLIIMGIAFAGVGAGEIFRRQSLAILSQPLERTGIFLPFLPVLCWWLAPASHVPFGELLLIVCAFYAILAAIRRSFVFGVLAALAGNGALWDVLWGSSSLGLLRHPQLWFIPAALSVLAAAQLNRERLSPQSLRAIRYACLLAVYVSSTADVFLAGVDRAPWLPLVLAGLSVAGVFAGISFRIRPFLYLGCAFLLLSVMTMIWFASSQLHWTWIWYVAGIVLGTAIIVTFALFEKRREQMLAIVEGLKQWQ